MAGLQASLRASAARSPLLLILLLAGVAGAAQGAVPEPGTRVPELRLTDLEGREWNTRALKGSVFHLAFVASWCEPCRDELPVLRDLARRLGRKGYRLLLVGVPHRESESRLRAWAESEGVEELAVAFDRDGRASAVFGVSLLPHHVIVGRDGIVGAVSSRLPADAEDRIRALLAGGE